MKNPLDQLIHLKNPIDNSGSRIRRPKLRVRPDRGGPDDDDRSDNIENNDADADKQARQLNRERSRIRRPQRRKPVENSFDSLDDEPTLLRFGGSNSRPEDEELEERPRFVPSNAGAKNIDRDPNR